MSLARSPATSDDATFVEFHPSQLDRVHGGAVIPSGVANIGYELRRALNPDAKAAIGRTCARAIPDNSSMFLNIGTTTEAVARELLNHKNITVVTNTLNDSCCT